MLIDYVLSKTSSQKQLSFWRVRSYAWIFDCMGRSSAPTPIFFKGQLYNTNEKVWNIERITEIQSKEMLLEKWQWKTYWMQDWHKPSLCKKNPVSIKSNKVNCNKTKYACLHVHTYLTSIPHCYFSKHLIFSILNFTLILFKNPFFLLLKSMYIYISCIIYKYF